MSGFRHVEAIQVKEWRSTTPRVIRIIRNKFTSLLFKSYDYCLYHGIVTGNKVKDEETTKRKDKLEI